MIYIKKYTGTNYFQNRNFIDSIKLKTLPGDGIPQMTWVTELPFATGENLGAVYPGDFDLKLDLLDKTKTKNGKTLIEFITPDDESGDYIYLVILDNGYQTFSGVCRQENIKGFYTYSRNDYHITMFVVGMLHEFSNRCRRVALSTLNFPNGQIKSFEEYIPFHFNGITTGVLTVQLPSKTYLQHLQDFTTNVAGCWAYGDFFNFILNKNNISRWEAFRELARGLGFGFELYLMPDTQDLNEPEFILQIFWLTDLLNEAPLILNEVITHDEEFSRSTSKWLFLKYRSVVISGQDYSNGIFFSKNEIYNSDADNSGNQLYPCCLLYMDNKLLSYDNGSVGVGNLYRDADFIELELKQYAYSHGSGGGTGKTYQPNAPGVQSAGFAYAKIFNAATGLPGQTPDIYDNKPIQRFAIENYKRFVRGWAREKTFTLPRTDIKNWRHVQITNENSELVSYYVSGIEYYDIKSNTAEVSLTKL